jgi:DNA-binding response OmpR family regulator
MHTNGSKNGAMLSILAVGRDERLLNTRAAVLRLSHADVVQALPDQALKMLQTVQFDLVVLCHSVSRSESTEVADLARLRTRGIRVLQVVPGDSSLVPAAETWADDIADSHPGRLVDKVRNLLASSSSSSSSPTA